MRTKPGARVLAFFLQAVLLALLWFAGFKAESYGFGGILAAFAKSPEARAGAARADEILEGSFAYTYESLTGVRVSSGKAGEAVAASRIGTSHAYRNVTGSVMEGGSFFTKDMQYNKEPVAVVNKSAAFRLYGGSDVTGALIYIDGEPHSVVGVMDDGDEGLNVYVPLANYGGGAESFISVYGGDKPADHIAGKLKTAGITENGYDFYDMGKISEVIGNKFFLALGLTINSLLAWFAIRNAQKAYNELSGKRNRAGFAPSPGASGAFGAVFRIIFAACLTAVFLWVMIYVVEYALLWYDYPGAPNAVAGAFGMKIGRLARLGTVSDFIFAGFCVTGVFMVYETFGLSENG